MFDRPMLSSRGRGRSARHGHAIWWIACLALVLTPAASLRADIFTPSVQDQIKLGEQGEAQVRRQYPVVNDERLQRVDEVGHRLLNALSPKARGPWHFRFHVIESNLQ